jgi:hypothetical protein
MRSFFNKVKGHFHGTREKVRNYWSRMMNDSKHVKMSEGAQQITKLMTSAHKDQWRRGDKK